MSEPLPSKQIAMQAGSWFDRKDLTLDERENAIAELIEAEIERRVGAVETSELQSISLNLHQAKHLLDFFGDEDADMSVGYFAAGKCKETGEDMPAGLYAWCTEYPEEGRLLLAAEPPDYAFAGTNVETADIVLEALRADDADARCSCCSPSPYLHDFGCNLYGRT